MHNRRKFCIKGRSYLSTQMRVITTHVSFPTTKVSLTKETKLLFVVFFFQEFWVLFCKHFIVLQIKTAFIPYKLHALQPLVLLSKTLCHIYGMLSSFVFFFQLRYRNRCNISFGWLRQISGFPNKKGGTTKPCFSMSLYSWSEYLY